jgi:hypothetical protein
MSDKLFRGAVAGSRDGATATTVIEQRVDSFLQHAFFVVHDNFPEHPGRANDADWLFRLITRR